MREEEDSGDGLLLAAAFLLARVSFRLVCKYLEVSHSAFCVYARLLTGLSLSPAAIIPYKNTGRGQGRINEAIKMDHPYRLDHIRSKGNADSETVRVLQNPYRTRRQTKFSDFISRECKVTRTRRRLFLHYPLLTPTAH